MWWSLLSTAHAFIYVGSPVLDIVVDRPAHDLTSGWTTVDKVRMHKCDGAYTDFEVDAALDPTDGFTVTITSGDWCGATVVWADDVLTASSSWGLRYEEPWTTVELDGYDPASVPLTPYTVVTGTMSGLAPRLYVTVE